MVAMAQATRKERKVLRGAVVAHWKGLTVIASSHSFPLKRSPQSLSDLAACRQCLHPGLEIGVGPMVKPVQDLPQLRRYVGRLLIHRLLRPCRRQHRATARGD